MGKNVNDDAFVLVLEELFPDALSENVGEIAGQRVRVVREANTEYGIITIYVTRIDTGAVYQNVGEIETRDGRWVDNIYNGWERM